MALTPVRVIAAIAGEPGGTLHRFFVERYFEYKRDLLSSDELCHPDWKLSLPRWPQEEVKALSHELIDAYERLFAYDEALVRLGELLAAEPILVPTGQEKPRVRLRCITHPQRSYQDVQNELAVQLANLPRFTAYVSIHGEQHQIKLSPPLVADIDEARIQRIRAASKARFGRPPRAPAPPVATAPTPTPPSSARRLACHYPSEE